MSRSDTLLVRADTRDSHLEGAWRRWRRSAEVQDCSWSCHAWGILSCCDSGWLIPRSIPLAPSGGRDTAVPTNLVASNASQASWFLLCPTSSGPYWSKLSARKLAAAPDCTFGLGGVFFCIVACKLSGAVEGHIRSQGSSSTVPDVRSGTQLLRAVMCGSSVEGSGAGRSKAKARQKAGVGCNRPSGDSARTSRSECQCSSVLVHLGRRQAQGRKAKQVLLRHVEATWQPEVKEAGTMKSLSHEPAESCRALGSGQTWY